LAVTDFQIGISLLSPGNMGGARKERRNEPAEVSQKHPALAQKSSKSPVTPVNIIVALSYFV